MKISIIIPAYNVEKYIDKCITSVINQTYDNIEAIIVNDGSTDNTALIIEKYSEVDNRIIVVNKENSGVSDSRNIGIENITGDYAFFLDSDDWIEENYIEKAVNLLNDEKIDILFNGWVIDSDGNIENKYEVASAFSMNRERAIEILLEQKLFGWGSVATFYKKNVIKSCRFDRNIRYGEDFYFKYQAIKKSKKFYYAPINAYHYVRRETSATKSYSIEKRSDDLIVIRKVMNAESLENSKLLYFREYIPRVVEYAIMSISSEKSNNRKFAQKYREEALKNFNEILFSDLATNTTKIKLLVLKLHPLVIKCFGKLYMKQKGITCD